MGDGSGWAREENRHIPLVKRLRGDSRGEDGLEHTPCSADDTDVALPFRDDPGPEVT